MTHPTTTPTHSENGDACRSEWETWKQRWNANFSDGHRSQFEVRLPNGRTFSFSLGHLLLAGLLLLWLPSNWVIFAIVLSIAWHYGLFSSSHAAGEKPKRKNDEPLPSDDVVEF